MPAMSMVRNVALFGRPIARPVIASISSIEYSPDSSARSVCTTPNRAIRLAMKLGVSFATTTPLPRRRSRKVEMRARTSASVSAVGITSTSRRYRGGLKKWVPSQCRLNSSLRPSASVAIGIPEVFEDTIVPGRRTRSICSSSVRFASMRSTTASTIQSAPARRFRSASKPPVVMSAAASRVKNGSGLRAAARFNPSRAISAVMSSRWVGTPALARCAAICAPIVPAPRTAADWIRGVIAGRPLAGTDRRRRRHPLRANSAARSGSSWSPFRRAHRRTFSRPSSD